MLDTQTNKPPSGRSSKISWGETLTACPSQTSEDEKSREKRPSCKSKSDGPKKIRNFSTLTSSSAGQSISSLPDTDACINQEQLQILEKMFEESADDNGALDMEGFQKVMKETFSSVSDETLESLFWKVDEDCNGLVTWRKYLDHLMREFRGKEEMRRSQYQLRLQPPMRIVPLNHGHEVVKLQFLANPYKANSGHFLTVTKDGILQFWDESFKLLRTFRLDQTNRRHTQQMWVNDMVCLGNINLMAVASTDQDIEFFDITGNKCQRTFVFIDLDSCALVMDYWTDRRKAVFCVGDTKGNVLIFISDDIIVSGLFHPNIFKPKVKIDILQKAQPADPYMKISMQNLLTEKSRVHRSYRLKAIHTNWCQQIKFISQINMVASCSAIDNTAMVLALLPSKLDHPKCSILSLRKGILCFDYCPDRNFLVTGGYDTVIRLWNPLFIKKPVWRMKGHQTSVTHIIVNGKNNCIISISQDKNIRLWDMHNFECFQSFSGKFFALGNHPITSAYFHKANDTFICGTYSIGILTGYLEAQVGIWKVGEYATTHHSALCGVLYSKSFRQVVSGTLNGVVSVWELATGKKVIEFSTSESRDVELTAMVLDELERCLITGLRNGRVRMWNYNIGVCLLDFPNPDEVEISGIVHLNGIFYVTGWSKRISWYLYQNKEVVPLFDHWPYFHTEDILCLAKYRTTLLGSSSYNGDIFVWNINWGRPMVHFNATRSPLAMKPKKVYKEETRMTLADIVNRKVSMSKEYWAFKSPLWPKNKQQSKTKSETLRELASAPPPLVRQSEPRELVQYTLQGAPLFFQKICNLKKAKAKKVKRPEGSWTLNRKEAFTGQEEKRHSEASVEKIIFLSTRLRTPRTATLLSSARCGYIYAWSVHEKGGLLGKFQPDSQYEDSFVCAMVSDEKDWILITGDTKGYIKIWDIMDYCRLASEEKSARFWDNIIDQENIYRNLISSQNQMGIQDKPLESEEVIGGRVITLIPPDLLISWQAHKEGVVDVVFGDRFHVVVTAGEDFNVKAWKISGEPVGNFGLRLWRRLVPVGETDTLRKSSFIDTVEVAETKEILDWEKEDDYAKALIQQRRDQKEMMALLQSSSPEAMIRLKEMAEQSIVGSVKAGEGVEDTWNKWKTSGSLRSDVVGTAYKPKDRPHLQENQMVPLKLEKEVSPRVFRRLPYKDLQDVSRSNKIIMKTIQVPKKKRFWLVTQQIIKALAVARQLALGSSARGQSFCFSPTASSLNSSATSISLSSLYSISSLHYSFTSSMSAASKKPFLSSSVSSKKKGVSNSSTSMGTKSSHTPTITTSSVPSAKKPSPIKPLKSTQSSKVRF